VVIRAVPAALAKVDLIIGTFADAGAYPFNSKMVLKRVPMVWPPLKGEKGRVVSVEDVVNFNRISPNYVETTYVKEAREKERAIVFERDAGMMASVLSEAAADPLCPPVFAEKLRQLAANSLALLASPRAIPSYPTTPMNPPAAGQADPLIPSASLLLNIPSADILPLLPPNPLTPSQPPRVDYPPGSHFFSIPNSTPIQLPPPLPPHPSGAAPTTPFALVRSPAEAAAAATAAAKLYEATVASAAASAAAAAANQPS
jgi:hypothetical protein